MSEGGRQDYWNSSSDYRLVVFKGTALQPRSDALKMVLEVEAIVGMFLLVSVIFLQWI